MCYYIGLKKDFFTKVSHLSYQALALKYRPRRFEDLIGQEAVSQTLSLALTNQRLGHAYLFSGLRGSGKTSTARIFAKALVCDKAPTPTPCEQCESCQMANDGRHIDIIEMDAASNRKIDDIRDLIEHTRYKPTIAPFKVFIIDEVHMLTKEAFNALLKTLEEPPSYIKFILATTDPLKLPPTILSRTQHFRFKKISKNLIISHLEHILNKENINFEKEALEILARSGNGSLRDTLTLLDQAIIYSKGFVDSQSIVAMLGLLNPRIIEELFRAVLHKERSLVLELLHDIDDFDPDILIEESTLYLTNDLHKTHPEIPFYLCERFLRILAESKNLLSLGADPLFAMTVMFLKMVEATHINDIDSAIEKLENSLASAPVVPRTQAPTPLVIPTVEAPLVPQTFDDPYVLLIKKLYLRSDELGECFERHIAFERFQDETLVLNRCMENASERCKELLKHSSQFIRQSIKECFGVDCAIEFQTVACIAPVMTSSIKKDEMSKPTPVPEPKPYETQKEEEQEQTGSTIEEIELANSCVAPVSEPQNPSTILDEPFIKKAIELFDPKKVRVHEHT